MINWYFFIFISGVIIASFSQVLLKISSGKQHRSKIREFINVYVISAYFLLFCSMIIAIIAYRSVHLKTGAVIESTGYVFVALFSRFMLHEKINRTKAAGIFLIVAGFIIFNL